MWRAQCGVQLAAARTESVDVPAAHSAGRSLPAVDSFLPHARGFASVVYPPAVAEVAKPAPHFTASAAFPDGEIKPLSLADYKGKWLVLLFYPKDFTFVCPTELIAFSDAMDKFRALGAEVVGVSTVRFLSARWDSLAPCADPFPRPLPQDTAETHLSWIRQPRKKGGLGRMDIPLLADVTKVVSAEYGTLLKDAGIALRGLFIVDPDGVLQQATINNLPVGRSVDETIRLLQAFQFVREHGEVCPANWTPGAATMKADTEGAKSYFSEQDEHEFGQTVPKLSSQEEITVAVKEHKAVVLEFYAPWCGKCAQIAPHVEALQSQHKGVAFYKVDTEEHPGLAKAYDAHSLPTFVLMQGGKEVQRLTGYKKGPLSDAVAALRT